MKAAYCVSGLGGFSLALLDDIFCSPGHLQLKLVPDGTWSGHLPRGQSLTAFLLNLAPVCLCECHEPLRAYAMSYGSPPPPAQAISPGNHPRGLCNAAHCLMAGTHCSPASLGVPLRACANLGSDHTMRNVIYITHYQSVMEHTMLDCHFNGVWLGWVQKQLSRGYTPRALIKLKQIHPALSFSRDLHSSPLVSQLLPHLPFPPFLFLDFLWLQGQMYLFFLSSLSRILLSQLLSWLQPHWDFTNGNRW